VGITNPVALVSGDTIEVCGIATYLLLDRQDTPPTTFGFILSWFDCSEDISGTGLFTTTNIINATDTYVDGRVCWGSSLQLTSSYSACNIHWLVGMNSQGASAAHDVFFSYNLHINRACS
jgi:hypothetical protein